jgi:hypothetical protein
MKIKIIVVALVVLILSIGYLLTRDNEVTVYLGIANANLNALPLKVSIDQKEVFNGTLANNPFKYEVFRTNLKSGIHSLTIADHQGYQLKKNIFIILDQHLVIEYYAPCKKKESCFDISNRLKKFRLE